MRPELSLQKRLIWSHIFRKTVWRRGREDVRRPVRGQEGREGALEGAARARPTRQFAKVRIARRHHAHSGTVDARVWAGNATIVNIVTYLPWIPFSISDTRYYLMSHNNTSRQSFSIQNCVDPPMGFFVGCIAFKSYVENLGFCGVMPQLLTLPRDHCIIGQAFNTLSPHFWLVWWHWIFFLHYTNDYTLTLLRNSLFNNHKQNIFSLLNKAPKIISSLDSI